MTGGLQEALPREHYVDAGVHERERTSVLLREWTCLGRLDDLGLTAPGSPALLPGRLAVVDLHVARGEVPAGEPVEAVVGGAQRVHGRRP